MDRLELTLRRNEMLIIKSNFLLVIKKSNFLIFISYKKLCTFSDYVLQTVSSKTCKSKHKDKIIVKPNLNYFTLRLCYFTLFTLFTNQSAKEELVCGSCKILRVCPCMRSIPLKERPCI